MLVEKSLNVKALFLLTSERFRNGSKFEKKQYINSVRLRAIETNKSILKISDDGVSCVILPSGKIELYLSKEIEQIQLKLNTKNSIYSQITKFL